MYLVRTAQGVYEAGGWFDAGWWAGLTLIAAAAWQTPPTRRARCTGDSLRLLIAPLVSGAVGLELLVYASMGDLNPLAVGLAAAALVFVMIRLTLTFRQNVGILRASRNEALTDSLTGLGNRRALTRELDDALPVAQPESPLVLALFDLDGFKHYNDTFGHPAGDVLLARLGGNLSAYFGNRARVFRMGGDEFCALFEPRGADPTMLLDGAALALSEQGDGFWIGCSYGAVTLPRETTGPVRGPADRRPADVRAEARRPHVRRPPGQGDAGRRAGGARSALRGRRPRARPTSPTPPPARSASTATSARRSGSPPSCIRSAGSSPPAPKTLRSRASGSCPPLPRWPRSPACCGRCRTRTPRSAPRSSPSPCTAQIRAFDPAVVEAVLAAQPALV